jgi:hypothetical protein
MVLIQSFAFRLNDLQVHRSCGHKMPAFSTE